MRDYAYFKPTEEVMKKYAGRVDRSYDSYLKLRSYCLKEHDSTDKVVTELRWMLQMYVYTLRCSCEKYIYEQWERDQEIEMVLPYPCDEIDGKYDDEEQLINRLLDKLVLFSDVVKTPDYFDESEKFYSKLNELDGDLEWIKDEIVNYCDSQIREDLKEFKVDDDSSI